jgi:H2-forming N5,N10-methylenetetrahydromethanopterin dehydrogenase-like enzyme
MSLNGIEKQFQVAGKGHNEILEIFNPLEHTRNVTKAVVDHVPENGGTCKKSFLHLSSRK